MTRLVIIGAGGHGKVVADCAKSVDRYNQIVFLDNGYPEHSGFCGWEVVGHPDDYLNFQQGSEYFVAIGNNQARRQWQGTLQQNNCDIATLVHPSSQVGTDVSIGKGTLVLANCVINILTRIGEGCIVNTSASVDHDCQLGDFVHIAPGVRLAGTVTLHAGVFMGVASAAIPGVVIGKNTVVGAGATVVSDIPEAVTVVGTPAKVIKHNV